MKAMRQKSYWKSRDFQRYFFNYILLFVCMLTVGVAVVLGIAQKERTAALEQHRQIQEEKIASALDKTWESTMKIGEVLNNFSWVEKYKSDSDVFTSEFGVIEKNDISQSLKAFSASDQAVRDIAIVYPYKDTAVTPHGWFKLNDYQHFVTKRLEFQMELMDVLNQGNYPGAACPLELIGFDENYLVYALPLDIADPPRAITIAFIDKNKLKNGLYQVCDDDVMDIRILNGDGEVCLELQNTQQYEAGVKRTFSNPNMLMNYEITFQDEQVSFFEGLGGYLLIIMLMVLGAAGSYILAAVQYSPVSRLLHKAKQYFPNGDEKSGLNTIAACIDELSNDNKNLEQAVTSYRYALRDQKNTQLLKGYFSDDAIGILDAKDFPVLSEFAYSVLLLHRHDDEHEDAENRNQERLRFLLLLKKKLQEIHLGQNCCELVENIEGNTAVIVEFQKMPEMEVVVNLAESLYETLEDEDIECGIYAARPCKGLIGISISYQAAVEMLRHTETGNGVICKQADVEYYYPLDWETQLTRIIRAGNITQAEIILGQLYEENKRLKLSRTMVRRVGTLLYETIRRVIIEARLPVRDFLDTWDPRYEMTLEQVFEDADSVVKKLCTEMTRQKQETATNVNRSLVEYVNANIYDPNLSLNQLSDIFGVSNASISRIFKKTVGTNFYCYITEKRMERAKEILRLRGYCPGEVASEIGYDSEYSFKRAFQRTFGISPRDYVNQQDGWNKAAGADAAHVNG